MIIKKVMPKIPVAKKRVAAYCRVSTFRNEQDESFETQQMFAIQACGIDEEGANRLPKHSTDDRYEIKSKGLVRLIYQSCGWDRTRSYRLPGVEYPQHRLVNYDLSRAIPIFEGRIDKKTQEAQRGEKALKA